MDWQEFINKKIAKKIMPDLNLFNSLIETSLNKAVSASMLTLNETTSSSIISLYYDSLREILEALGIKNGYKIYNHEGYVGFIREVIKNEKLADNYDKVRKIRNALNYYGKKISINETKEIISDIKTLIKDIKNLLKI